MSDLLTDVGVVDGRAGLGRATSSGRLQEKHVKQPATETTMNLMDDIDAITAKGKGGIVADAAMDVAPAPLCT